MTQASVLAIALTTVLALDVGQALSQTSPAGAASGGPTVVPLDSEATMGGLRIGCTGVGQSKDDPKWKAYPVRIEFSNPAGDLLANGAVSFANGAGAPVASVSCEGPWIVVSPSGSGRGAWRVTGWLPGQGYKPISQTFSVPASGQRVIDLRFAQP